MSSTTCWVAMRWISRALCGYLVDIHKKESWWCLHTGQPEYSFKEKTGSRAHEGSIDPFGASWRENHITGLLGPPSSGSFEPRTGKASAMWLANQGTCSNCMMWALQTTNYASLTLNSPLVYWMTNGESPRTRRCFTLSSRLLEDLCSARGVMHKHLHNSIIL